MAPHGLPTRLVRVGYASRAASIAILGAVIALVPVGAFLVYRRLPYSYDVLRYLVLSQLFSDAIAAGAWSPRWIPDLNGGYGYPQFVFYQPGYFYLSHLFAFVGAPVLRCTLTLSTVALAGAFGAYRLIRCFVPAPTSLFFLLLFQLHRALRARRSQRMDGAAAVDRGRCISCTGSAESTPERGPGSSWAWASPWRSSVTPIP